MSEFNTNVWICPTHGVILEDNLAEGVDHSKGIDLYGEVAWTGKFYCQYHHEDDQDSEVEHVELANYLAEQGLL